MSQLRLFVPEAQALTRGNARVFRFRRNGQTLEGFVLGTGERLVAYANDCPHWRVDLDLGDGNFWDETNGRILCKNHGARFHPETGLCEVGPCAGLSLEPFELEATDEGAWVIVPGAEPEVEAGPGPRRPGDRA